MLSRTFDSCDIPTKRSRLSLPGINSFTCKTEVADFDFGIGSTRSTSNFDKFLKTADNIATILCDADSIMASTSIAEKNEKKSHYFKQEETKPENNALVVNIHANL